MPVPPIDLTGQRFGRWTVVSQAETRTADRIVQWVCRCVCGSERVVSGRSLRRGRSVSCGCSHADGDGQVRRAYRDQVQAAHARALPPMVRMQLAADYGWSSVAIRGVYYAEIRALTQRVRSGKSRSMMPTPPHLMPYLTTPQVTRAAVKAGWMAATSR